MKTKTSVKYVVYYREKIGKKWETDFETGFGWDTEEEAREDMKDYSESSTMKAYLYRIVKVVTTTTREIRYEGQVM